MAPGLVAKYPILGEFSYGKMFAVMIVTRWNEVQREVGQPEVATGVIRHEMQNILAARRSFQSQTGNYYVLVVNYNLHNKYSLVAYFSRMHHDFFNCGSESMENKLLLIQRQHRGHVGRGGSKYGDYFCFAILDWAYESRSQRQWLVANANR